MSVTMVNLVANVLNKLLVAGVTDEGMIHHHDHLRIYAVPITK